MCLFSFNCTMKTPSLNSLFRIVSTASNVLITSSYFSYCFSPIIRKEERNCNSSSSGVSSRRFISFCSPIYSMVYLVS
ncbi:wsv236 [White spot syndrome virus]|uniref:Wsv236 n=1 Tax=White spot syndrome virus TaxID=342409 RepID=K7WHK1_9VIRU|nr:wsv236 [White spot syndrome virus]